MKNCNLDTVIPENTFLAKGPGGEQMEQFTGQCEKLPTLNLFKNKSEFARLRTA